MNHRYYLIISVFFLSIGCTQIQKNYVAKVKLLKLTESEIYNKELVYDVIFDSQELALDSIKSISRQIFLKGVDLYKNKKNPIDAIDLFRQSILIFPDSKTYYELGNAILDSKKNSTKSIRDAINAFEVAEYLDFKPLSMVYYKTACAYNILRNADKDLGVYGVTNHLRMAFNNGFSDTLMISNDNAINSIISTREYKDLLLSIDLSKIGNNSNNLFVLYKESFQGYQQPFEISFNKLEVSAERQSISYDFAKFIPEMQNTSFGREVSHDFFYVAKVAETPEYTAIIYSSMSFWEQEMQPVMMKLVTYNNEGTIVAEKLFAGQFSAEKIKIGKIENNEITLKDYKRVWKLPIDKVPFDENIVEKYELIATATFKLTDIGEIQELSVPANYSDSVIYAKN